MAKLTESVHKTNYLMDLVLLLLFILACVPQVTGIPFHEWESLIFLIPFVIHLLLHWDWMIKVPPKVFSKLEGTNRFNVIWDVFIYLLMMLVMISGTLASKAVLPALGMPIEVKPFWNSLHHSTGNLIMPALGIHLAVHWSWIRNMTAKMFEGNL